VKKKAPKAYCPRTEKKVIETIEDFISRDYWKNYYHFCLTTNLDAKEVDYVNAVSKSFRDSFRRYCNKKKNRFVCGVYVTEFSEGQSKVHYHYLLNFGGKISDSKLREYKTYIRSSWHNRFIDDFGNCSLNKKLSLHWKIESKDHLFNLPAYFAKSGDNRKVTQKRPKIPLKSHIHYVSYLNKSRFSEVGQSGTYKKNKNHQLAFLVDTNFEELPF
tara:strand:+ start:607 stop:1254 length:648 start_codon:yes stop_codon:yes gene_type:complete